ncbi:MAG TPA: hypothetical protein VGX70_15620 [Gemmataceae bacterium]|jgi:hypothetical protein|nr:hypothetical protein [Gemmataceae bacterium]
MEFSLSLVFLGIPLGLVISVVLGAFILQAACALCNIEDVRYMKALGLLMLLIIANAPIVALILFLGQGVVAGLGWGKDSVWSLLVLAGYPLHWLLSGLVLFWPLHVGYWKGVLVSIMQNIITVVVAGVVGGLALVVLAVAQLVSA